MGIKILGGKYKGLVLKVPSRKVRPTAVMLKRKIFDAMQDMSGYHFFDLCAGSGGVGFEALSRGAASVSLIELGDQQFRNLKKSSLFFVGEGERIKLFRKHAVSWLDSYLRSLSAPTSDHILFLDPPYDLRDIYFDVLEKVFACDNFFGELWVEVDLRQSFIKELSAHFDKYSQKSYQHSDRAIFILRKSEDIDES